MRFTLNFGKHVGEGNLSPEQRAVIERLERDEITAEEAEKLLGGTVRVYNVSIGTESRNRREAPPPPPESATSSPAELSEEEIARRLVERIAQEVDAEAGG